MRAQNQNPRKNHLMEAEKQNLEKIQNSINKIRGSSPTTDSNSNSTSFRSFFRKLLDTNAQEKLNRQLVEAVKAADLNQVKNLVDSGATITEEVLYIAASKMDGIFDYLALHVPENNELKEKVKEIRKGKIADSWAEYGDSDFGFNF